MGLVYTNNIFVIDLLTTIYNFIFIFSSKLTLEGLKWIPQEELKRYNLELWSVLALKGCEI